MLINIPEQVNCARCSFCEEGSGTCLLAEEMHLAVDHHDSCKCHNEGWKQNIIQCRPEWCPFIKEYNLIGKYYGYNVYLSDNAVIISLETGTLNELLAKMMNFHI